MGEDDQVDHLVVEPAPEGAVDEYPFRDHEERPVEGKLEIGEVFLGRVTDDLHPFRNIRADRVQVADNEIRQDPERTGESETTVRADDGVAIPLRAKIMGFIEAPFRSTAV